MLRLLIPAVFEAVDDTTQPDVEQPDLSVQVVDLLLQRTRAASAAPVRPDGPRHEVHGHDEAQRQHRALGVALELLQDVQARQGKEGDACQPEKASEHSVQEVKEPAQEHGEEPVGQEHGCNQEQSTGRRVGEGCGAEVMAEVRGIDAHHIQQIRPHLPDGVQEGVHAMDESLGRFGKKLVQASDVVLPEHAAQGLVHPVSRPSEAVLVARPAPGRLRCVRRGG